MTIPAVSENTSLATITSLIGAAEVQVQRIVDAVLGQSVLATEVAALLETTDAIRAKLVILITDQKHCSSLLARLEADTEGRMQLFDSLDDDERQQQRTALMKRLDAHLTGLQTNIATLERGIDLSRAGMVNRFATFAVAGLSLDAGGSMVSGRAFINACLVAARLKDKLEIAGFRWTGEKSLITLYLNAIGCERRRSKKRHVADPIASAIATALGFVSAMQLHQALFALHGAATGATPPVALGHVRFDQAPCAAFEQSYYASTTPEQAYNALMQRLGAAGRT